MSAAWPANAGSSLSSTGDGGATDVALFQWLRQVEKHVASLEPAQVKAGQSETEKQLVALLTTQRPAQTIRDQAARCLLAIYLKGESRGLFDTTVACHNVIKAAPPKDAKQRADYVAKVNTALHTIAVLSSKLARTVATLLPETVNLCLKLVKAHELSTRVLAVTALTQTVEGGGRAVPDNPIKEILKVARGLLTDKSEQLRIESAACIKAIVHQAAMPVAGSQLEDVLVAAVKGLDGSTPAVRQAIASLLAALLSSLQPAETANNKDDGADTGSIKSPSKSKSLTKRVKVKGADGLSADDLLGMLSQPFIKAGHVLDVRIGLAIAYTELFAQLGAGWVEDNIDVLVAHLGGVVSHPKCSGSQAEELAVRSCAEFILRHAFGRLLPEAGQIEAVKALTSILKKHPSGGDSAPARQALVIYLIELGNLIGALDGAIATNQDDIIDIISVAAMHPSPSVRQAVSWLTRSVALASSVNLHKLLTKLQTQLTSLKPTDGGHKIKGVSVALGAALTAIAHRPTLVSFDLPSQLVSFAISLVGAPPGTTTYASTLSVANEPLADASALEDDISPATSRVEAGWTLLAALSTIGSSFVGPFIPSILEAMSTIFVNPKKDAPLPEWKHTIRVREGVLGCLAVLLSNDDAGLLTVSDNLASAVGCSNAALASISQQPPSVRGLDGLVRKRLFQCYSALPSASYVVSQAVILRTLVETLALTSVPDNAPFVPYTSTLPSMGHNRDTAIAGWLLESDNKTLELLLTVPFIPGGEFDNFSLFERRPKNSWVQPLVHHPEVAAQDAAVSLFGALFPQLSQQQQETVVDSASKAVKAIKPTSPRRQPANVNIVAAILSSLRTVMGLGKQKTGTVHKGKVVTIIQELLQAPIITPDSGLRCAAADTFGRLTAFIGGTFVQSVIKSVSDSAQQSTDPYAKAGFILVLGAIMHHVGGMASSSHIQSIVGLLSNIANDANPIVHTNAVHSLSVVVEAAGLMFQNHVKPTLNLTVKLFLSETHTSISEGSESISVLYQSFGRMIAQLMATLGPELQSANSVRALFLCVFDELRLNENPIVAVEALRCVVQLILFAPDIVDVPTFLPLLQKDMHESSLPVRKAAIVCLLQLVQRDALKVHQHGETIEEHLFALVDSESDPSIMSELFKIIHEMQQSTCQVLPSLWLNLIRHILSARGAESGGSSGEAAATQASKDVDLGSSPLDDGGDDDDAPPAPKPAAAKSAAKVEVKVSKYSLNVLRGDNARWESKAFAIELLGRLVTQLSALPAHMDLAKARERGNQTDSLVKQLADLIRMVFNPATSSLEPLRLAGLPVLQIIIEKFAPLDDPDYEGHSLLEQYQAQLGAALRPAFTPESSAAVIAAGCNVCAKYVTSGVMTEPSDLNRMLRLLLTALDRALSTDPASTDSKHERTSLELASLAAWATVVLASSKKAYLKDVVAPHLDRLSERWLLALVEYAKVKLPADILAALDSHSDPAQLQFLVAKRAILLPAYESAAGPILGALASLSPAKLGLLLGSYRSANTAANTPSPSLVLLSLTYETLYNAVRDVDAAATALAALTVLLNKEAIGPAFIEQAHFSELIGQLNRLIQIDFARFARPVLRLLVQIVEDFSEYLFNEADLLPTAALVEKRYFQLSRLLLDLCTRALPLSAAPAATTTAGPTDDLALAVSGLEGFAALVKHTPSVYVNDIAAVYFGLFHSLLQVPALVPQQLAAVLGALRPLLQHLAQALQNETFALQQVSSSLGGLLLSLFETIHNPLTNVAVAKNCLLASAILTTAATSLSMNAGVQDAHVAVLVSSLARPEEDVRVAAVQCIRSLLTVHPFMIAGVPEVVLMLTNGTLASLPVVQESAKLFTALVAVATTDPTKTAALNVTVPVLVSLLSGSNAGAADAALQVLLQVGPLAPQAFKTAVANLSPSDRTQLETAIRQNAAKASSGGGSSVGGRPQASGGGEWTGTGSSSAAAVAANAPKIQLKMSF